MLLGVIIVDTHDDLITGRTLLAHTPVLKSHSTFSANLSRKLAFCLNLLKKCYEADAEVITHANGGRVGIGL